MGAAIVTFELLLLVAIGELVSRLTRARLPSLLVSMVLFLGAIWSGILPVQAVSHSALILFGDVATAMLLVHMGTMIPWRQFKQQWRAALITLIALVMSTGTILLLVSWLLGYDVAVAGAGPLTGGFIATLITVNKLNELHLGNLVAVAALLLGVQQLVGMPLAAVFMRRHARKLLAVFRAERPGTDGPHAEGPHAGGVDDAAGVPVAAHAAEGARTGAGALPEPGGVVRAPAAGGDGAQPRTAEIPQHGAAENAEAPEKLRLPAWLQEPAVLLTVVAGLGCLATGLGELSGVPATLWGLMLGIVLRLLKILPERVLDRCGSFNVVMVTVTLVVIAALSDITPASALASALPVTVILAIGTVGICVGGWVGSKLLRVDPDQGLPVALTAMFGFPGDYLLCEEVSQSATSEPEEQRRVLQELFPPMLVGGFVSVTSGSVVIAAILVRTL